MTIETVIKIGEIVRVEITGLQKYGAFVKFGKQRGLIHISELKSGYISNIHDVVVIGQVYQAQIIDIDEFNGKISLSLRSLEKFPKRQQLQRRFHFNYPNRKIGFQPFNERLPEWIAEQLAYLKKSNQSEV